MALLRGGKVEKPAAKAEGKPAEDRVVRVGDVWCRRMTTDHAITAIAYDDGGERWAVNDAGRLVIHLDQDGAPLFSKDWTLVRRAPEPLDAAAAIARLREIADYHADKGGTDLDRALRSVGR